MFSCTEERVISEDMEELSPSCADNDDMVLDPSGLLCVIVYSVQSGLLALH